MEPIIKLLPKKKLVGKRLKMSRTNNKTTELWRAFMPRRKEITNSLTTDLFSLQVYPTSYFKHFSPTNEFEKWALTEVADFEQVPKDMEPFVLKAGQYAVFLYKGSSADNSIFEYIYSEWLPNSEYTLDNRPHFELLGEKYKNNDSNSEEEIWIPIKSK